MRCYFFHLMPYQRLPEDFSERYHSVWVDVPAELCDPVAAGRMYNEYLDEMELADRLGFDGICVNEHHQNAYGLMPSPNLMAAALARRAPHGAIVVMGNSLALYNPPIRVAEEFAMLDCVSGGRLVAGFPVGTAMDTCFCYGQVPTTLREKYEEAHDLVVQAWTRPDVFPFNGKYTQLRYVNIWPRPIQKPHPPVWIPGSGSIETWEWCARHDYVYAYLSYYGYKRGRSVLQGYWETLDRLGIERNPYRAGFLQFVAVSESLEQAERDYWPHAQYFYRNCQHVADGFADAPGYRTLESVAAGQMPSRAGYALAKRQSLTWQELIDRGYLIAGNAASVRDQLVEVAQSLNVGHLMLLLHFGSMPRWLVEKNTELFARDVLPGLRPLFSQWEDRWYPRGAQPAALPALAANRRGGE